MDKTDHFEDATATDRTPGVAWLTVLLGGALLAGNVAELGGVQSDAREWTAWMLSGLLLVHGFSLAWRWREEDSDLRLPRWPLLGAYFVLWLGYAWRHDQSTPWLSRESFYLAAQAWLLCWVVSATPGGRALSWAWLLMVAAAAGLALMAALGWQTIGDGRWLPLGHQLPTEWVGRWSGTLPQPGAFGAMMLLAGAPLLVMACSRPLPSFWRILCGSSGLAMLLGAILSNAMGAWLGVLFVLALLPGVVGQTAKMRWTGWIAGAVCLLGMLAFRLLTGGVPFLQTMEMINAGDPPWSVTQAAIALSWQHNPLIGAGGLPMLVLIRLTGVPGPEGGWSYGFSDWSELAAVWGLLGLGFAVIVLGGLLLTAWSAWARLPFLVSTSAAEHSSARGFTPEAKVLLGAGALGLSAFAVAMLATRSLNVPAVVFAFAVVAGVLARNVPQRGGNWRLDPVPRCVLCLFFTVAVAVLLIGKVAPAMGVQRKLAEATELLAQADRHPDEELLARAEADLHEVLTIDPASVPALINLSWLELEQSRLDPRQTELYSRRAEYDAIRAGDLAPRAPAPWIVRGLACWLDHRFPDADRNMRQALSLAPYNPDVEYYVTALLVARMQSSDGMLLSPPLPLRYFPPPSWPPQAGTSEDY